MRQLKRCLFLVSYLTRKSLVKKNNHFYSEHVNKTYITGPRKDNFIQKHVDPESLKESPLQEGFYSDEQAQEILKNLTPEEQVKLEAIKLEYEIFCSQGFMAPMEMKDRWWVSILKAPSYNQRRTKFKYFHRLELHKAKKEIKKAEQNKVQDTPDEPLNRREKGIETPDAPLNRREESTETPEEPLNRRKESLETSDNPSKRRKENRQTIFMHIYNNTMVKFKDCKSCQSMLHGRPFIVDMSFEKGRTSSENTHCISQLFEGYGYNRALKEPNDIIFTDWIPNSYIFKKMNFILKDNSIGELMAKMTDQHFIDLYPAKQLVYLSPHATETLTEDHPDNIYILAALVDKKPTPPITHVKARELGIRCVKLPLDQYLHWGVGSKSLTLDQCMKIMFDFMDGKGWEEAFEAIPKRKLADGKNQINSLENNPNCFNYPNGMNSKRETENVIMFKDSFSREFKTKSRTNYRGQKKNFY